MVGGQEAWDLLKKMEAASTNSARGITNRQLVSNGFDLCYRRDVSGKISVLEITGMTNFIPGYGFQDLKELLQQLLQHGGDDETVLQRPQKVLNWFQTEAKRLSGKSSPSILTDEVLDLLKEFEASPADIVTHHCPHNQPIFHRLCKIPTLEASQ